MGGRVTRPATDNLRLTANLIMSPAARMILRCLVSTAIGTLPGIAWRPAPGIGIALIGALAGLLMGLFRISPRRVGSLTLGVMAAYNLGGASDRIFEKLDDTSDTDDEQKSGHDVFQNWVLAEGIHRRRGWLVVVGLATGLIAGAAGTYLDARQIMAGNTGLLLPLQSTRDPLLTQAIVATLGLHHLERRSVWPVRIASLSPTRGTWADGLRVSEPLHRRCRKSTQCYFPFGIRCVLRNSWNNDGPGRGLGRRAGVNQPYSDLHLRESPCQKQSNASCLN